MPINDTAWNIDTVAEQWIGTVLTAASLPYLTVEHLSHLCRPHYVREDGASARAGMRGNQPLLRVQGHQGLHGQAGI